MVLEPAAYWEHFLRQDQKADYQKACDYLIGEAIDLELIYQDHTVASDLEKIVGV